MFQDIERRGGGGGGRPRIRFGRLGARGRMFGTGARATGGKTKTAVVKSKYVKAGKDSNRHIGAHLRYIEERERGENEKERSFFDRDRQGIERREVEAAMRENKGEKAAMHKLILSPGDNSIDLKDYTRDCMEQLEKRLGHELDWYGVTHENTDHNHAHVVIAGKIPDRQRDLERREAKELAEQDRRDAKEISDLLYGEKREERQIDDIDSDVRELLPDGKSLSPQAASWDKFLDKYEREMAQKQGAQERGDVYLDRNDLNFVRSAGNHYLERERSVDREIERSMEQEFGRHYEPEREHERGRDFDIEHWQHERGNELTRQEPERGRGDDDEHKRNREDRGDGFGR